MPQKYLDLVTLQAMGDLQFHFLVNCTILSQVFCGLVHFHADAQHTLQGTLFEPLGGHGHPECFGSPWNCTHQAQ